MMHVSVFARVATFLLLSAVCTFGQKPTPEPRLALIMGVGDYRGTKFPTLPGIDKDLQHLEAALKATGFQVTVVSNPTLSAAEDAIETFGAKLKAQAGGVGLFYFSGHGGEFEGRNYLIPKRARISGIRDIKEEAVAAQRVLNRMEDAGARVNIVFLDCCRNDLTKAATDSGLAPMTAKGTFIGFATDTDKTSLAGSEGSPYTTFLARRLLTPGISILDMHTQVTADVEDYTKANGASEQTPFQYSGLRSSFFFVPSPPDHVNAPTEVRLQSEGEIAKVIPPQSPRVSSVPATPAVKVPVATPALKRADDIPPVLVSNKPAKPPDLLAPEPAPATRYDGTVGRLSVVFFLQFQGQNVSGKYFPTQDPSTVYVLSGTNPEGRLQLTEYTQNVKTARISLKKSTSGSEVIWKGEMNNTDGRRFAVTLRRSSNAVAGDLPKEEKLTPVENPDGERQYHGNVGPYEAYFKLRFLPNHRVTGSYAMPIDKGLSLRLEGTNPEGKLNLDEYTDSKLTGRFSLERRGGDSASEVRWEGTLHNTPPDNRVFHVSLVRSL